MAEVLLASMQAGGIPLPVGDVPGVPGAVHARDAGESGEAVLLEAMHGYRVGQSCPRAAQIRGAEASKMKHLFNEA